MIQAVLHVVGIDKLLLQFLPFLCIGLKRETVSKEVVGSSILVHTAHEIGDGIQEMLLLHNGCIEDDVVT